MVRCAPSTWLPITRRPARRCRRRGLSDRPVASGSDRRPPSSLEPQPSRRGRGALGKKILCDRLPAPRQPQRPQDQNADRQPEDDTVVYPPARDPAWGAIVVLVGLGAVLVVFCVALVSVVLDSPPTRPATDALRPEQRQIAQAQQVAQAGQDDVAQKVAAITGPAFAAILGLVAAYFGVRAGSLTVDRVAPPPPDPTKPKRPTPPRSGRGGRRGLRGRRREPG